MASGMMTWFGRWWGFGGGGSDRPPAPRSREPSRLTDSIHPNPNKQTQVVLFGLERLLPLMTEEFLDYPPLVRTYGFVVLACVCTFART